MKNKLIVPILILSLIISCKKNTDKKLSVASQLDTIFLDKKEIIFITPNTKTIDSLKNINGENFYTIADDADYYYSIATNYLDSLKISYKNYNDDKIIGFKTENQFIEIPKYKSPWYVIFYQNKKFKTLDFIDVQAEYSKFFNLVNPSSSRKIMDSIAMEGYFVVEKKKHDLNEDTFIDEIIVLGNNEDIDPQNPDTKIAPIIILLNQKNKKYEILKNERIYPNNYGDMFKKLEVKNHLFTVELFNEIPDKYTIEKYITFSYREKSKDIILLKYEENINWNDGTQQHILYTEKDFGKVLFQDFNANTIHEECSK